MTTESILTIISCLITGIVGVILSCQIKSQKAIIERYKGLVEVTSPDKIVTLHKIEIEQLTHIMSTDINELKKQVLELALYVNNDLNENVKTAKYLGDPSLFVKEAVISKNMPHCAGILSKVEEYQQSTVSKA